jgi:acetyltransferase-like isoleucine patch superfamily enzyme
MPIFSINQGKQWIKNSPNPIAKIMFKKHKVLFLFELPAPRFLMQFFYHSYTFLRAFIARIMRFFIWTPLFKGRLEKSGTRINLYGGLPYVSGPLIMTVGNDCRISGQTTFSARTCGASSPQLQVGNNVDIGWMTTIAIGSRVQLGDNVRIAGRAFLAGYPGHPIDPLNRALGLPDTEDQVGDIIIENDVWLATGVSVMAGVTIGQGSIIAAGSVVTHDIPAMVLAAGVPAKVIRSLPPTMLSTSINKKNG